MHHIFLYFLLFQYDIRPANKRQYPLKSQSESTSTAQPKKKFTAKRIIRYDEVMKEIYLLRHAEKNAAGALTEFGQQTAEALRPLLPGFTRIFSSDSGRTVLTAKLLTGQQPQIDQRAAYATSSAEVSKAVSQLAAGHGLSFLEAARLYGNEDLIRGIAAQAEALNTMINDLLDQMATDEKALIVSHDLTIVPAMQLRGLPVRPINPLSGYIINMCQSAAAVRSYPA